MSTVDTQNVDDYDIWSLDSTNHFLEAPIHMGLTAVSRYLQDMYFAYSAHMLIIYRARSASLAVPLVAMVLLVLQLIRCMIILIFQAIQRQV